MIQQYYSNGKLLLSGEYLILDGAVGLALPTSYGQSMAVSKNLTALLTWESFDHMQQSWFKVTFNLDDLSIRQVIGDQNVALTLQRILKKVTALNPAFLGEYQGLLVKTFLDFPRIWGLGSSSTLINNIAQWADVDPYQLLFESFGGSGYDIACAQNDSAILYRLNKGVPNVRTISFQPDFGEHLYFVHLNRKQVSKDSIELYKKGKSVTSKTIERVSNISASLVTCKTLNEFDRLLAEHESILATVLHKKTLQQSLFTDFKGQTKSLGAWGGDFILATGDENTPVYFKDKGFETVIPYSVMIK
jgi:mevalonate kinase